MYNLSGFYNHQFLIPQSHQAWTPMTGISRLTPLSTCRKVQMETPESIRASLIPGKWVLSIDLLDAYFLIPILQAQGSP